MTIKRISALPSFVAADQSFLKELFHPKNDPVDLPYSLAYAILEPGQSSLPHILEQSELYVFLEGEGMVFAGEETSRISKGDLVLIPPKTIQYLKNSGSEKLAFLCIVAPPWSEKKERIL